MGPHLRTKPQEKKREKSQKTHPLAGFLSFDSPSQPLFTFQVLRLLLFVFCHEFVVVISGRDWLAEAYCAKAEPEVFLLIF